MATAGYVMPADAFDAEVPRLAKVNYIDGLQLSPEFGGILVLVPVVTLSLREVGSLPAVAVEQEASMASRVGAEGKPEGRGGRIPRRSIALLTATGLMFAGAAAQAERRAGGGEKPSRSTERIERRLSDVADSLGAVAAKGKKKWLMGPVSHTYERSPVSGTTYISTIEVVGYKGKRDASWPRVGDVYLGQIWVGRAGDAGAGDEVVTEVKLPRKTSFAIKKSKRSRRVRCYKGKSDGSFKSLGGRKCPNRPVKGVHGWRFVPRGGSWDVPKGRWIQIVFPLRSRTRLRGLADSRNACIVGSVHNLSGWAIDDWDAPEPGEKCPLKDGHGSYQGVFVAKKKR
ncbi:MAG: hypothetical protein M3360_07600 [Actinomycetota bacterium]|nr:hypothetical protein [Actinomycetota bacterium]